MISNRSLFRIVVSIFVLLALGGLAHQSDSGITAQAAPALASTAPDENGVFHEDFVWEGNHAATVIKDYPQILADDPDWAEKAKSLAARTHEIVSFLTDVLGVETVAARFPARATYHDSCTGLRSLGIKAQPRQLLASVEGLELNA
ncbi:MAG: hypothetical protein IIC21_00635, partial [Chloroflexi bacterium]|nr:hypothetical protein [Chloroflexota bacterium]